MGRSSNTGWRSASARKSSTGASLSARKYGRVAVAAPPVLLDHGRRVRQRPAGPATPGGQQIRAGHQARSDEHAHDGVARPAPAAGTELPRRAGAPATVRGRRLGTASRSPLAALVWLTGGLVSHRYRLHRLAHGAGRQEPSSLFHECEWVNANRVRCGTGGLPPPRATKHPNGPWTEGLRSGVQHRLGWRRAGPKGSGQDLWIGVPR
jgi:hypothetical protein